MEIEVKYFAAAREAVGTHEVALDVPEGVTVGEFREMLMAAHPGLRDLSLHYAVNMIYVSGPPANGTTAAAGAGAVTFDTVLRSGDVVACIPPVGGG